MLMLMAPTLNTAALLVFSPRWALYRAWDLAMLHFTTVLGSKEDAHENAAEEKEILKKYLRAYKCFQVIHQTK